MKRIIIIALICIAQYSSARTIKVNAKQPQIIKVLAQTDAAQLRVQNILDTFGLYYQMTDEITKDDGCLYIIAGKDLSQQSVQPDHYIVYQTEKTGALNIDLLKNASAIWDASWENINRYQHITPHYYYLPDENYEFLDPVALSCFLPTSVLRTYKELLKYSNTVDTDISSHVPTLFCHAYFHQPEIVVEAGVRGDEGSTVALQAVSRIFKSKLIGIDVNDDSWVYKSFEGATFLKIDDRRFPEHFKKMDLSKKTVDLAFIDTSHEYQHTLDEIDVFSSILSENGMLAFHDGNVTPLENYTRYSRLNGTLSIQINGVPRGVGPAIKLRFNNFFNENAYINQTVEKDGYVWHMVHYPYCNGLTLIKRISRI